MSAVRLIVNDDPAAEIRFGGAHHGERIVARAVVIDVDPVIDPEPVERGGPFFKNRNDTFLFVIDGNDNGQVEHKILLRELIQFFFRAKVNILFSVN